MTAPPLRVRLAGPIVIGMVAIIMLFRTWGTWPDAMYDFGSQLYYPWQMTAGRHLYTDIAYFNGPLSQYFNAMLFAIFGVSLRTLVYANLLTLLGTIVLIYRIIFDLSGRLAATGACIVFLTVFAFSQYVSIGNYNWVCPYTHEVTHGVALSIAMIAALNRLHRTHHRRWLGIAGALLGLIALTKAEVFIPALGAMAVGCLLRDRKVGYLRAIEETLAIIASAAIVILIAFTLLAIQLNPSVALRAVLGSWPWVFDSHIAHLQFYRQGLGIDDLVGSLQKMVVIGAAWGVLISTLIALAFLPRQLRLLAWTLLIAELLNIAINWRWTLQLARPWPVMVGLIAIVSIKRGWSAAATPASPVDEEQRRRRGYALRAMLSILALGLLGKMLLNARIWQYGFALAMPAAIVLVEAVLGQLPRWNIQRGKSLRIAGIGVIGILVICLMVNQMTIGPGARVVGTGADQFQPLFRGGEVNTALAMIERTGPANGTLAVMPQGLMLNYLSRRSNPVPAVNLMPPEVLSIGEDEVIRQLNAHPPDAIVLSEGDIRDEAFTLTEGHYHYGQKILAWVTCHYVRTIRADDRTEMKLSLWKRR